MSERSTDPWRPLDGLVAGWDAQAADLRKRAENGRARAGRVRSGDISSRLAPSPDDLDEAACRNDASATVIEMCAGDLRRSLTRAREIAGRSPVGAEMEAGRAAEPPDGAAEPLLTDGDAIALSVDELIRAGRAAEVECGDPDHRHSGPCTVHPDRPVCGDPHHRHSGPCRGGVFGDPRPRVSTTCSACGLGYGTARGVTELPDRCPACKAPWRTETEEVSRG